MDLLDLGHGEISSMVLQKRNGRRYLAIKGLRPGLELCVEFCSRLPLPWIAGELLIPEHPFSLLLFCFCFSGVLGHGFYATRVDDDDDCDEQAFSAAD